MKCNDSENEAYRPNSTCGHSRSRISAARNPCRKLDQGGVPDFPVNHPKRARRYSPIVRMTLLSGRVLFEDSLSSCESISSYFGTVVSSPFGTMCTTL